MRIVVKQIVEVDPELWALEYGLSPCNRTLKKVVRDDVKEYFTNFCQQQVTYLDLAPRDPKENPSQ